MHFTHRVLWHTSKLKVQCEIAHLDYQIGLPMFSTLNIYIYTHTILINMQETVEYKLGQKSSVYKYSLKHYSFLILGISQVNEKPSFKNYDRVSQAPCIQLPFQNISTFSLTHITTSNCTLTQLDSCHPEPEEQRILQQEGTWTTCTTPYIPSAPGVTSYYFR